MQNMEFWKWERKICNSFERARLQIEEGHRPLKFNRDTIKIRNTNGKKGLRGKFVIPLSKRGQQIEEGLTTQSVSTSKLMQRFQIINFCPKATKYTRNCRNSSLLQGTLPEIASVLVFCPN